MRAFLPGVEGGHGQSASYIVEIVIVPFVLLFCLGLPLIDLATITTRVTLLWTCVRDANFHAAKAKSFVSDVSAKSLSAKNIARQIALMEAAAFNGVNVDSVETAILITDMDKKIVSRQFTALAIAPDTDKYLYQIEVVVNGRVRPLLLFSKKWFGNIPGLTEWISVTVRSKEYCENPQGLML